MKSIQTKFTIVLLAGLVACTLLIGGAGILSAHKAIDKDSVQMMNLLCGENAQELNNTFNRIEQAVEILAVHALASLESTERLVEDAEYFTEYTNHMAELGQTIVNDTRGAIAIYYRYSPELTGDKKGFFKVLNAQTGLFEEVEMTGITDYSEDDMEYVGWYYEPVKAGTAIWIMPYLNRNIGVYMISYVIPVYSEEQLVGVIGMDIDFSYITQKVDEITLYETGYAFLAEEDFTVVHNPYFEKGHVMDEFLEDRSVKGNLQENEINILYKYRINGEEKRAAFCELDNGMYLAVSAPLKEIDAVKNDLMREIAVLTIFILTAFLAAGWYMSKTIVKPLKEITRVAEEVAKGNLDLELDCNYKDEVGVLANSMQETVLQLKKRTDYINKLAYTDSLTGLKNNTAYLQKGAKIREEMEKGLAGFAIYVVDVNGLKKINDELGHEYGNQLLVKTAEILKEVFAAEDIYRVGGDEFVVFLWDVDDGVCKGLEEKLYKAVESQNGEIKPVVAAGYAIADEKSECIYKELFQQADARMYIKKKELKMWGSNSEIKLKI